MIRTLLRRLVHRLNRPAQIRLNEFELRLRHLEMWAGSEIDALDQRIFDAASAASAVHQRRVTAVMDDWERRLDHVVADARSHAEAGLAAAESTAIAVSRAHTDAATDAVWATAQRHTEESIDRLREEVEMLLAPIRTTIARLGRTRPEPAAAPASGGRAGVPGSVPAASVIDDVVYLALEDRLRGDPAEIRRRQERYVERVRDLADPDHPVLDLGCGRGEWIGLLVEHGIPVRGVDSNASCVAECVAAGLDVVEGELLVHLAATPDASVGAITMFQVVEHLPFAVLADVLANAVRVLRPGGVLIAETPNALNLRVAATTFWLDPTHQHPVHPELLRFLAEQAGFVRLEDVFSNPLGTPPAFDAVGGPPGEWLGRLAESIDGPADYALVAWTPAAVNR